MALPRKEVILKPEEKEKVLAELISSRRHYDLAMFICTQNYNSFEDIFLYGGLIEDSFYMNVFTEIYKYYVALIVNDHSVLATTSVTNKIKLNRFVDPSEPFIQFKGRGIDYYISNLILSIAYYFADLRLDDNLNEFLSDIFHNESIPGEEIVRGICSQKPIELSVPVLKHIIYYDMISIKNLLPIIVKKHKEVSDYDIEDILHNLLLDRDLIIPCIRELLKRYYVVKSPREVVYNGNIEDKEAWDLIRTYVSEIVKIDVEMDFYNDYVEPGLSVFLECGDKRRSMIYSKLQDWYIKNIESSAFIDTFCEQEYVDKSEAFPLSHEEVLTIVSDINTLEYLGDITDLSLYQQFIRYININRFDFIKIRHKAGIEDIVSDILDIETDLSIELGFKDDVYIFVNTK
ncbi:MAG: hypothetical protein ACRC92_27120 [Peptostreptococcaceae bacterium]